jgi:pSer/pThr/pTyr-binding forkhead associated (FHA) protein
VAKWLDTFRRSGDRAGVEATVLELMVIEGADAGQQFTVDGPHVTIGRGKPQTGQTGSIFLHDTTVSAEQASIHADARGAVIEHNARATNPTLVNGRKVRRHRIRPGDEIRMGRVVVEVREREGIALSGLFASSETDVEASATATPSDAASDADATTLDPGFPPLAPAEDAGLTQVRATAVPTARGRLRLLRGVSELVDTTYPLTGAQTIIGRSRACDVSLPEPGLSRQHCRIEWEAGDPVIVHMSKTNATSVNGEVVEARRPLADGDEIQLADQVTLCIDLGTTDAVELSVAEEPTLPPQSADRSLRAYMEEKIERDRMIEEEFSVQGSFLDIDVVGSYQMKAETKRPAAHIIVSFERFRAFVGGIITEFGGQVLNSNGDELMCFFESTLQSVRAGSAVLQRLDQFNERENVLE